MKKIPVKWFGYLFYFAFLIISCAGTEVTQKQVDDAYKEKPVSDILVIAITGNEHNRRSFEKKFVAHLKSVGVDAVASEESIPMPPDLDLKKETILNAVNQYKNDAVIITQLIGKEARDVYNRGGVTRMGYFSYSRNPGYSSTSTTVRLETNLYDAKTGKLIWSGVSKTLSKDSTDRIMNDVIKAVITQLKQNKLIVPK
jgi:PBP1b-binding outer membrane lipoprotein LpoB